LSWFHKHQYALATAWARWIGPEAGRYPELRGSLDRLESIASEDRTYWHGWYARHGGSTVFLGDHLAPLCLGGVDVPTIVLLLLAVVLMALFWRAATRGLPTAGR
jgi:hypothetical protein